MGQNDAFYLCAISLWIDQHLEPHGYDYLERNMLRTFSIKHVWSWNLLLIVTICFTQQALAAGINCRDTHDPVVQVICSYPKVLALDTELSNVYARALERNPKQDVKLQKDEIDWIGQRNLNIWWTLALNKEFPSMPTNVGNFLEQIYNKRIPFIESLDINSINSNDHIADKLLKASKTVARNRDHVLDLLQRNKTIALAKQTPVTNVTKEISTRVAPPDAELSHSIVSFLSDAYPRNFTFVYLPKQGLGGVFTVQGTAVCQYWILFQKKGHETVPAKGARFLNACNRDNGTVSYLALIGGYPAALKVHYSTAFPTQTTFSWMRWRDSHGFGHPHKIIFRYSYKLKLSKRRYRCKLTPSECTYLHNTALRDAHLYMRNALLLASQGLNNVVDRDRFKSMLDSAPNHRGWASCVSPVWFPDYVNGQLLVGGITQAHIACHPDGYSLHLAWWGKVDTEKSGWGSAHAVVHIINRKLLFAALVPSTNARR